jgi:dTDP-glucose pyrophosphorylase
MGHFRDDDYEELLVKIRQTQRLIERLSREPKAPKLDLALDVLYENQARVFTVMRQRRDEARASAGRLSTG